jgi:hypothetical protein
VACELALVVPDELAGDDPPERFDDPLYEVRGADSRMRDVDQCQRIFNLLPGELRHQPKIRQMSNCSKRPERRVSVQQPAAALVDKPTLFN